MDPRRPSYDATETQQPGSAQTRSTLRILYAVGPGDAVGHLRSVIEGTEVPFQPGMAFSEQVLDAFRDTVERVVLISSHPRADRLSAGPHSIENLPKPALCRQGGLKYHLGETLYGLQLIRRALQERATVVIADSGTTYWFVFGILNLFKVRTIAVLHNAMWPKGYPPRGRVERILRGLDGWFFRHIARATVCVSPECEAQVRSLARTPKGPVFQFRAQYRLGFFDQVKPPRSPADRPFNVLFLGRVEEGKGVFLIAQIAKRLEQEKPGQFRWKIVGSGSALDGLRERLKADKLESIVEAPGRLAGSAEALETFGWSHVVIVPTTSRFAEGMAMTSAEAILSGRPAVVTQTVHAEEVLGPATVCAKVEDVDDFVRVLSKLPDDREFYEGCRRATQGVQAPFYDRSQGLGSVLMKAIAAIQ